jgi:hypothetical protein
MDLLFDGRSAQRMGMLRTPLFQMQAVSPARFVPRPAGRKNILQMAWPWSCTPRRAITQRSPTCTGAVFQNS